MTNMIYFLCDLCKTNLTSLLVVAGWQLLSYLSYLTHIRINRSGSQLLRLKEKFLLWEDETRTQEQDLGLFTNPGNYHWCSMWPNKDRELEKGRDY